MGAIIIPGRSGPMVAGSTASALALKTGLQAFWEMEELSGNNRLDATGNGHTWFEPGSPIGSTTFLAGGSGNAASITGTTAFQAFGTIDFTGDFSVVMWINFGGSLPAGDRNLLHLINGAQMRIRWNASGSVLEFVLIDDGLSTFNTASVSGLSGTNTPYFIAATVTTGSNNVKLSVNDGTKSTTTKSVTITNSGSPNIVLGDEASSLNVVMDQVGIYNRAITNAEITALYASGAGLRYSAM